MHLGKATQLAEGLTHPGLTDADRVRLISAAEDLKNQLAAHRARLPAELVLAV